MIFPLENAVQFFEMQYAWALIDGDSQTRMVCPYVSNVLPLTYPYK